MTGPTDPDELSCCVCTKSLFPPSPSRSPQYGKRATSPPPEGQTSKEESDDGDDVGDDVGDESTNQILVDR